ncbi:MAG: 50S ribosomal protein L13 [Candidatus Altiarchaeota archaeon]|nr:50S ribosomal protein L13 [Candidatus Altiarchaeota archaeon]
MILIDVSGLVLGRVCSYAAKKALLGEDVVVINAENALVSGEKELVFRQNLKKLDIKNKGNYTRGPFHQKRPDRYVRRAIRGMLPFEKMRGREAFKRVNVYIGAPAGEIKKNHDVELSKLKKEDLSGLKKTLRRSVTVGDLCKFIGGSW